MSAAPSAHNPPEIREPEIGAEVEIPAGVVAESDVEGGEFPGEFQAAGVPVKERGGRTDETIFVVNGVAKTGAR